MNRAHEYAPAPYRCDTHIPKEDDWAILDTFWSKDDSLDKLVDLPPPDVLQAEIIEHLEAALATFCDMAVGLRRH